MLLNSLVVVRRVASKEITLFFSSPVAYLFLAVFSAVSLFVFFWGESFFARNIADVRPLFEWMPILLIFLCSTLTMRLWSEERRTGTLEHVLTQPAPLWAFVVGKFLGCIALLVIALLITFPLPITVAFLGELDWGPVWSGYLAAFFLGAAYLSIGLFVSSRSNNQIVSLIIAAAVCGLFYLVGSPLITNFFGNVVGEVLRMLGTGSRFDSITRGVIDIRDLYYYLSIVAVFLLLNTYVLERERWTLAAKTPHHKKWQVVSALLVLNAIGGNLWLGQMNTLRVDTTEGRQYSVSDATRNYLSQLQEPLLLRGYFSSKTHPLLAPLVPQVRDLLREYEIAGENSVVLEVIDPLVNPELEEEANQLYGIEPVPFQVADRYQSSIVSSYFNVLVQYGDEYEVLGFRDLIDVKATGDAVPDVRLRNPEHDLTRAIKKVLTSYQAGGNLFTTVKGNLAFSAYISSDEQLPAGLQAYRNVVEDVVSRYQQQSDGRFAVKFVDPQADGGVQAQRLAEVYGLQPMAASLFSNNRFYFHLLLEKDGQAVQIPLDDLTDATFERNLKAGIKRFAGGFTKTVAMVTAPGAPSPYGAPRSEYSQLEGFLSGELNVVSEDLSDGAVSALADVLLLAGPEGLDEKSLFAVDQFLMQGGTVIASTSPKTARFSQRIDLADRNSGLEDWLQHHGISIGEGLVMDPQNAAFPAPVTRQVGNMQLQEMRMLNYPYFVDIRRNGLSAENPITSELPQITMAWASPISVDSEKNGDRTVTTLMQSSAKSWVSDSIDIMPKVGSGGGVAYTAEGEPARQTLAVIAEGKFDSFFADKDSPLLEPAGDNALDAAVKEANGEAPADDEEKPPVFTGTIKHSPQSARLVIFASNDFLRDPVVQMMSSANGNVSLAPYELMANTIDWSLEDTALMQIRSRGQFNRTLSPMQSSSRLFWEYLNYALAALALGIVAFIYSRVSAARQARHGKLVSV
ncbi:ABC transporter permease [Chromatiales bacterium (ex Bugula neritina AB1)]|nr:ABC transporter permease [Chromatiales bacterium (ex Bugula neritina AB1)]